MKNGGGFLVAWLAVANARDWFGAGPTPWLGGETQLPFSNDAVSRAELIDWVKKGANSSTVFNVCMWVGSHMHEHTRICLAAAGRCWRLHATRVLGALQ
jgi:hypothetical protein